LHVNDDDDGDDGDMHETVRKYYFKNINNNIKCNKNNDKIDFDKDKLQR
jgi:hypothetical protein